MKHNKILLILSAFACTIGVGAAVAFNHGFNTSIVAAETSDPAAGASYYATNEDDKYYQGISDTLTGENLIVALSTLTTTGFVNHGYSELPSIYQYSDLSLSGNGKMRMAYTGTEVSFSAGSMPSNTNKEHVWPASWYGNGSRTESAGSPGADAHNVWPSASDLNSKRGSCAFDELNFTTSYKCYEFGRTDWSYGTEGDNDSYVWSTAFNYSNGQSTDAMYPSKGNRGAIARILMYVATRYRNNTTYPVMLHDQAITLNTGRIGKLSTLLKWHFEEPPSEWEIKRNNEVATRWHHDRNPFIDHPEYASRIYYYLPEPGASAPTTAVKTAIETYGSITQSIKLDKTTLSINLGESAKINISSNPNNETISFLSSNNNVATVDNNGNISAISVGTATITAQGEQTSATCSVTVKDPSAKILVTGITLSPTSQSIKVGAELTITPTIAPTDASDQSLTWESSNTGVAVVNDQGKVTGVSVGNASITARANDGSGKTAVCNLTITKASTSTEGGWTLVEDAATLTAGDKVVIATNTGFTAGAISSNVMGSVSSTFSTDKKTITTLGSGTVQLTLGGQSGAWKFANDKNSLLGATAVRSLAFGSGTSTWTISISNGDATIQNATSTYGRFLYNVSSPRFTTYTSSASSSMLLPQLYVFTEPSGGSAQEDAYAYVSTFMNTTSGECSARNVQQSTWTTLASTYSELSIDAKNYIYDNASTDTVIKAMIDRYTVIINQYGYERFITNGGGTQLAIRFQTAQYSQMRNDVAIVVVIVIISLLACSSFIGIRKAVISRDKSKNKQ